MRKLVLFLFLFLSACSNVKPNPAACVYDPSKTTMLEFEYRDFGPQAAAGGLLGFEVWSWVKQVEDPLRKFPIVVIVYGGIDEKIASDKYPVSEADEIDVRYVHYKDASEYLYWYSAFLVNMRKDGFNDAQDQERILSQIVRIEENICEDDRPATWTNKD